MTDDTLIVFQWDAEASVMRPLKRFHNYCNATFVDEEFYRMTVVEERSMRSHRHYFATMHDAWLNLPDDEAINFANDEDFRKHCLIMCGYRHERKFVASSPLEARKIAAFLRQPRGEYAVISVSGNVVLEWTAMSQSLKAMPGKTFQESKTACLEFAADLLGVPVDELSSNARQAA